MKNVYLIFLLTFILPFTTNRALASHAAGGEITYQWISDSTYRFYFNLYRDCSGVSEADTVRLCFKNPCNSATDFSILLNKASGVNGTTMQGCAQYKNNCDSPSSIVKGFRQWIYTGIAAMPARCSSWNISAWIQDRNTNNNVAIGTSFYTESMMNNMGSYQGNSSPYFTTRPIPEVCINVPIAFNNGGTDPNGDSLVYEMILPRYAQGSCLSTPINITLNSAYSLPSNPFSTNNTFWINNSDGTLNFTPYLVGSSSVTVRTKEYRNNVLIGRVDREVQIQVLNCNSTPPTFNNTASGLIDVCVGQPVNFCWYAKSSTPNTKLIAVDNHTTKMPGSSVTYSGQGTDSVRGCFSWVPTLNDAKGVVKRLDLWIKDSTCNAPGILKTYYYSADIFVSKPANAGKDTAICPGDTVQLNSSGQGLVAWSVISGTPNSLTCTTCQQPRAIPTTKTSYELLIVGGGNPCVNSRDTITIFMAPYNKPSVTINVAPDSNIRTGTTVTFSTTTKNCNAPVFQWQRNGVDIPGAKSATYTTSSITDNDVYRVKMKCSDTCVVDTISNNIKMRIGSVVNNIGVMPVCSIQPNPNKGEFTLSGFTGIDEITAEVYSVTGIMLYKQAKVKVLNGEVPLKLNGYAFSNGVYILQVKTNNNVYTDKLIIQQ